MKELTSDEKMAALISLDRRAHLLMSRPGSWRVALPSTLTPGSLFSETPSDAIHEMFDALTTNTPKITINPGKRNESLTEWTGFMWSAVDRPRKPRAAKPEPADKPLVVRDGAIERAASTLPLDLPIEAAAAKRKSS